MFGDRWFGSHWFGNRWFAPEDEALSDLKVTQEGVDVVIASGDPAALSVTAEGVDIPLLSTEPSVLRVTQEGAEPIVKFLPTPFLMTAIGMDIILKPLPDPEPEPEPEPTPPPTPSPEPTVPCPPAEFFAQEAATTPFFSVEGCCGDFSVGVLTFNGQALFNGQFSFGAN